MTELIMKLGNITDVYDDFMLGVINYAKKSPEHVEVLNKYISEHPSASTSDVTEFIIQQPDFYLYSACEENVG